MNIVYRIFLPFLLLSMVATVRADDGLVKLRSQFDVKETIDRFEGAAKAAGMGVFARIDHAAGAVKVGMTLRPTELIIFGNPKVGTGLMTSNQQAGIDLPLKALAWQDADGAVWLGYTRPDYLLGRFSISDRPEIAKKMTGALAKFAKAATQP